MPAISQLGFGSDDYPDIPTWLAAEEDNDYSGAGPIAEIDASTPMTLSSALQVRFGSASKFTIRAAAGSEFNGNLGGSHAKILGDQTLDIRVSNFNLLNIDFTGVIASTGDTYDGLSLDGSCVRGTIYLDKTVTTPVSLDNTIIYSTSATNNRVLYINGTDTNTDGLTVIATNAASPLGAIYVRNSGSDVALNNTAVYSGGGATYEIHSGDTPTVTGDYNAGTDGLLPGANSVATLTSADFVDFDNLDFRIASDSPLNGVSGAFHAEPPVDETAPTFSVAPAVAATATGGTFTASLNELGDIFWVVVDDGATAPSKPEVFAGTGSGGSGELAAGNDVDITSISDAITGLSSSTAYDLYTVARDDEDTPNEQAAVTKVDFTTLTPDVVAPEFTSAEIDITGEVIVYTADEAVGFGAGGSGGFTLSTGETVAYVSGAGTTEITCSVTPAAIIGAATTTGYTQPTDGLQDEAASPNDMVTFSGLAVSNLSRIPAVGWGVLQIADPVLTGDGYLGTGWTGDEPTNADFWYYQLVSKENALEIVVNADGGIKIDDEIASTQTSDFTIVQADGTKGTIATYSFTIDEGLPSGLLSTITNYYTHLMQG